jgi:hypothetical protein
LSRGISIAVDDVGHSAILASPEDAIRKKLQYFREDDSEKHIRDIRGVLLIQGEAIDFGYLRIWANRLNVAEQLARVLATN